MSLLPAGESAKAILRIGSRDILIAPRSAYPQAVAVAVRCLLIDDSEEFLASAQRLLSSEGLEIAASATTGEEGLRLAEVLRPDLALVDVQLGDEDGIDVARRLAQRVPGITIVLVSTHSEDDVAELIDGSAAAGFLPKAALSAAAVLALVEPYRDPR